MLGLNKKDLGYCCWWLFLRMAAPFLLNPFPADSAWRNSTRAIPT